jgi:hypothetical protein
MKKCLIILLAVSAFAYNKTVAPKNSTNAGKNTTSLEENNATNKTVVNETET